MIGLIEFGAIVGFGFAALIVFLQTIGSVLFLFGLKPE